MDLLRKVGINQGQAVCQILPWVLWRIVVHGLIRLLLQWLLCHCETNSNVHTMLISQEDASFGTIDSSKVHGIMDKFTDRGLRSLVVARQQVLEKSNESAGDPRGFVEVTSGLREE
ncbi:hypothetical protein SUGI_0638890 [Cryptomeria japonica]|nr:hypothetical protein SUGI_0638890 [Cryptomeria japonica]